VRLVINVCILSCFVYTRNTITESVADLNIH